MPGKGTRLSVLGRFGFRRPSPATLIAVIALSVAGAPVALASAGPPDNGNVWINGAGDWTGYAVSGAGDVNGDGRGDVIVGAPAPFAYGELCDKGAAYVIFGQTHRKKIQLPDMGDDGFEMIGQRIGDCAGLSVSGAGDVNGDGLADVIVGAPQSNTAGRGHAYVVFGKASTDPVDLGNLGDGGFEIDGAAPGDMAGDSVAGGGDVNGDGLPDVIVGAWYASSHNGKRSGIAYVVFGKASPFTSTDPVDLGNLGDGGFEIDGAAPKDMAGDFVANAGDANGDGHADIALSAPWADNNKRMDSGSIYVVFGKASTDPVDLARDRDAGIRIDAARKWDTAGLMALAGAGDVNGDGLDDVVFDTGDFFMWPNLHKEVLSMAAVGGSVSPEIIDLADGLGSHGFRILVSSSDFSLGGRLSAAGVGDANSDGLDDLLIGTGEGQHRGRYRSGSVFLVPGQRSRKPVQLSADCEDDHVHFDGFYPYDDFGWAVGGAGDTNGDGRPDAVIGAYAFPGGQGKGAAFVIAGSTWSGPDC